MLPGSVSIMTAPPNNKKRLIMKILSVVMLSLLFAYCNNAGDQKKTSDAATLAASMDSSQLTLTYFGLQDIPDSLSGCAEGYAFDTVMLAQNRFILFTDLSRNAIIKINNQRIFLQIDHREVNDKEVSATLSGQGYTIKLKTKKVKQLDDEFFLEDAVIEVEKNGVKKVFTLHGNSGC